jgi:hypothetical protein
MQLYLHAYKCSCSVTLQLYLRHDFYYIIFKNKHKLYIASGSVPPPPPMKNKSECANDYNNTPIFFSPNPCPLPEENLAFPSILTLKLTLTVRRGCVGRPENVANCYSPNLPNDLTSSVVPEYIPPFNHQHIFYNEALPKYHQCDQFLFHVSTRSRLCIR